MQEAKIAKMLCRNSIDWYVVFYDSGKVRLQHETSLSNIIDIGHDMRDYGITNMIRCGARNLDEAWEWLGD